MSDAYDEYLRLREAGLRRDAFVALQRFIELAVAWPVEQRRDFVDGLLSSNERQPHNRHQLPHPLLQSVVVPTLEAWMTEAPHASVPRRWLGALRSDKPLLREALALDAGDDVARRHLIADLLRNVDYATHHLVEGNFIGDLEDAVAQLEEATNEVQRLRDSPSRKQLQASTSALAALIADWQEYVRAAAPEPFREWCERRGHNHGWWSIVYYNP